MYSYNDALPLVLDEVHPDIFVDTRKIKVLSNDSLDLEDNTADDVTENYGEEDESVSDDVHTSESEGNVCSESSDRLSIAPLTNRCYIDKRFRRRPLENIGLENVFGGAKLEETRKTMHVQLLISYGCKR